MLRLALLAPFGLVAVAACAPMEGAQTPPTSDAPDQCRASQYQSWVGRNRSQLPAQAPAGVVWRVHCDTCAVTMDYNPGRMNVVFDTESGVIERVSCG